MGTPKQPKPVRLFAGIMYAKEAPIAEVVSQLEALYGPADLTWGPVPFSSFTDYYEKESGKDLHKIYLCFAKPVDRAVLPCIKLKTNEIEQLYQKDGSRSVNIDPGYLSRDKLVLASTKDFFHRIYLGEGIFGEVTLHYRREVFRFFSWTYPDYKQEGLQKMLMKARDQLESVGKKTG